MKKNKGKNSLKLFIFYAAALGFLIYSVNFLITKTNSEMEKLSAKNKIGSILQIDIKL